ncbi:predicted protein [Pyrenophora tritici-repentis Pt-1C-BFP]|uniref:Uncharacterized protein n=1 Tax=Pyrenophora tritici-repentis (strain Pt-1C-BFP) TaxID=426418 RepID=B2WKQ6_PYRTR|nr:uncharacterized protein PTRG_10566 [Pyrenophora tritici-repentis Pt-1C-BFP]EDU43616.1 predicted protein [Pyrenophora tritici-repentis Pt-1C-BFP]
MAKKKQTRDEIFGATSGKPRQLSALPPDEQPAPREKRIRSSTDPSSHCQERWVSQAEMKRGVHGWILMPVGKRVLLWQKLRLSRYKLQACLAQMSSR